MFVFLHLNLGFKLDSRSFIVSKCSNLGADSIFNLLGILWLKFYSITPVSQICSVLFIFKAKLSCFLLVVFFVYFSSLRIFVQYVLFIFNHVNIPFSFLLKFLVMSPVCATHILLGRGPSVAAWSIIGKYYCRKLILPFSTTIKFNTSQVVKGFCSHLLPSIMGL